MKSAKVHIMKRQSILVLAMVVLTASETSRADMIIQLGSWDLSESISITAPTTYSHSESDSVPFSLFDPSLGHLTSVEYKRISGVANTRVYAHNISQQEGYFDHNYNVVAYVSRTPLSGEILWFSSSGGFGGGSPFPDPLKEWTLVGGGGIDSEGSYTQYYSGSELDQFIGVGTFDLAPRIDVSFSVTNISPNIEAIFEANYAFAYEISYVYEPTVVPVTPIANSGGPYFLDPGGPPIMLEGSVVGDFLQAAWDLNLDGLFDDAFGLQPLISVSMFESWGFSPGMTWDIGLQVMGLYGGVDTSMTQLTFTPVPSAVILGSIGLTFTGWLLRKRSMM